VGLKPDYADAYYNLGTFYEKSGDYDRAIASYRDAIRLRPDFAHGYYDLACTYSIRFGKNHAHQDKQDALQYLHKAAELNPKFKDQAKTDSVFVSLRDDSDFTKLVGI